MFFYIVQFEQTFFFEQPFTGWGLIVFLNMAAIYI